MNATASPRSGRLLHEAFVQHAERQPARPALFFGDRCVLSYGELHEQARRVAGALCACGVVPSERVVVCAPKGPAQIAAVLGCLYVGACYVPVGVEQPHAQRERIISRSSARVVLLEALPSAPVADGVQVLLVRDALETAPIASLQWVSKQAAAYTLFTSGSTGEPKGVVVPHRAAVNTIEDLNERFGVGQHDRTLALSALDSDFSGYNLFGALAVGGAAVLVDEERRKDARRWHALMAEHRVSILNCVPSVLDMLLSTDADGVDGPASLRLVLLGGDWVGVDLPRRLKERSSARFVALGGTTETAIHSTFCEVDEVPSDWTSILYGVPLRNVACRVVDPLGRDCPDWVRGELWIGGDGVADGYLGEPARTAERFVAHEGMRWYRTGDLARYRPAGQLEFLGRADAQVKLRGHRIELGEVEAALERSQAVASAVALVVAGRDSSAHLAVAYVPSFARGPRCDVSDHAARHARSTRTAR